MLLRRWGLEITLFGTWALQYEGDPLVYSPTSFNPGPHIIPFGGVRDSGVSGPLTRPDVVTPGTGIFGPNFLYDAYVYEPTPDISNGSFETGNTRGWYSENNGGVSVELGGTDGSHYASLSAHAMASSPGDYVEHLADLKQDFSGNAGDELVFDYHVFDSYWSAYGGGFGHNSAHVELFNVTLGTTELSMDLSSGFLSDWSTVSHVLSEDGDYLLTFEVSAMAQTSFSYEEPQTCDALTTIGIDAVHLVPIPEPATLVLFGLGAVSLLAYAWRGRKTGHL